MAENLTKSFSYDHGLLILYHTIYHQCCMCVKSVQSQSYVYDDIQAVNVQYKTQFFLL